MISVQVHLRSSEVISKYKAFKTNCSIKCIKNAILRGILVVDKTGVHQKWLFWLKIVSLGSFLRSTYFKIAMRKSKFVEIIVNPTAVSTAINDDNSKSRLVSVIFSVLISDIFILSVIFGFCSVTTKKLECNLVFN